VIAISPLHPPDRLAAKPPRRLARPYWLCQATGWSALIAAQFATYLMLAKPVIPHVLVAMPALFTSAFLASCGLHALMPVLRRRFAEHRFLFAYGAAVAATALLCATVFHYAAAPWLEGRQLPPILALFMQYLGLLASWSALYFAISFYRGQRAATLNQLRLEAARREAELRALKAQINPHFLFNSLNTLRALIPRELDRPRHAVTLLADLLREALNIDETTTVPLKHELATVDNYLALEQLRFESRLRVVREIDSAALSWPVPSFLVQGLVENAIKHGIACHEAGGQIVLRAMVLDDTLHLSVTNCGQLRAATDANGIGLTNARARLDHLFAGRARLGLRPATADTVVAELVIPRPAIALRP